MKIFKSKFPCCSDKWIISFDNVIFPLEIIKSNFDGVKKLIVNPTIGKISFFDCYLIFDGDLRLMENLKKTSEKAELSFIKTDLIFRLDHTNIYLGNKENNQTMKHLIFSNIFLTSYRMYWVSKTQLKYLIFF